jgi:outer membrane protein
MKKGLFTVVALVVTSSLVQAQTEKGRWLVGAQVGNGSYQDQNQAWSFSIDLTPSAGYFVAKNLLVGARLPLSFDRSRSYEFVFPNPNTLTTSTSTSYGLGPFARYYIGEGKLKPYVGASFTYGRSTTKREQGSLLVNQKINYTQISPTVGLAYFINRNVALNAGISYDISRYNYDISGSSSRPGTFAATNKAFSLDIGFQILFGK